MPRLVLLALALLVSAPARASECTSIRDEDKRRECLAVERRDPAACVGIRDVDARMLCRQLAGQRPQPLDAVLERLKDLDTR